MEARQGTWWRSGRHIVVELRPAPDRFGVLQQRLGEMAAKGASDAELAQEITAELEVDPELWEKLKRGVKRTADILRIVNLVINPLPPVVAPPPEPPVIVAPTRREPRRRPVQPPT